MTKIMQSHFGDTSLSRPHSLNAQQRLIDKIPREVLDEIKRVKNRETMER